MTTYLSPGVYVKEVPSGSAPIAGVGTSTAGFLGNLTNATSLKTPENDSGFPVHFQLELVEGEVVGIADGSQTQLALSRYPVSDKDFKVEVVLTDDNQTSSTDVTGNWEIIEDAQQQVAYIKRKGNTQQAADSSGGEITVSYFVRSPLAEGEVKLCTNFTEFQKAFGGFSDDLPRNHLAHAVYGFFQNGGTRCFVTWVSEVAAVDSALEGFAAIDEIAIVAAPGTTDVTVLGKLDAHCQQLGDRFAIFDSPEDVDQTKLQPGAQLQPATNGQPEKKLPQRSDHVAYYYPWIQVFDPATNAPRFVPPSGHVAGVYARVDTQRGVHKAPANEVILGAMGVSVPLSRAKQDGLNPQGVNCIRNLNGNIRVWGARTWGGDANGEFKYINIRRLFNYLRESIDEGTQWTVFEPNSPELWAKIRRNISAFLTLTWRSGALFGNSPEEAFFVKCDEETNPPEVRDAGQVVTVIGVAVVKPAEFVIFELSQWAGPGGS